MAFLVGGGAGSKELPSAQRKASFQLLGRLPVGSAAERGGLFGDAETVRRAVFGVPKFSLIFLIKIDPKWESFGSLFWYTFSIFRALSSGSYFLCFWEPLSRRL